MLTKNGQQDPVNSHKEDDNGAITDIFDSADKRPEFDLLKDKSLILICHVAACSAPKKKRPQLHKPRIIKGYNNVLLKIFVPLVIVWAVMLRFTT